MESDEIIMVLTFLVCVATEVMIALNLRKLQLAYPKSSHKPIPELPFKDGIETVDTMISNPRKFLKTMPLQATWPWRMILTKHQDPGIAKIVKMIRFQLLLIPLFFIASFVAALLI